MKIVVVFDYPHIADVESTDATNAIEMLTADIQQAGIDCDSWNIEEVFAE